MTGGALSDKALPSSAIANGNGINIEIPWPSGESRASYVRVEIREAQRDTVLEAWTQAVDPRASAMSVLIPHGFDLIDTRITVARAEDGKAADRLALLALPRGYAARVPWEEAWGPEVHRKVPSRAELELINTKRSDRR